MGIPFYTESANILSVLVTLREVFHSMKIHCLIMVIGEFARSDCIEDIVDISEIEQGEEWEEERYVTIETMWKPVSFNKDHIVGLVLNQFVHSCQFCVLLVFSSCSTRVMLESL